MKLPSFHARQLHAIMYCVKWKTCEKHVQSARMPHAFKIYNIFLFYDLITFRVPLLFYFRNYIKIEMKVVVYAGTKSTNEWVEPSLTWSQVMMPRNNPQSAKKFNFRILPTVDPVSRFLRFIVQKLSIYVSYTKHLSKHTLGLASTMIKL